MIYDICLAEGASQDKTIYFLENFLLVGNLNSFESRKENPFSSGGKDFIGISLFG